ncbi:MAG: L,D-transpeptidase [Myxococcota bacterium]
MTSLRLLRAPLLSSLLLLACGEPPADAAAIPPPSTPPAQAKASPQDPPSTAEAEPEGKTEPKAEAEPAPKPAPEPEPAAEPVMAPPPPPESLTHHGLAAYEVVTIYARPDLSATKLGYLRFGHRTMVTAKVDDAGEGCGKGWHQLPSGGYACRSKGLSVEPDKEPYMHQPPPRPRLDDPMPYDYGVVARDGAEMWWRTADSLERELAAEKFEIQQQKEAAAAGDTAPSKPKPNAEPAPAAQTDPQPEPEPAPKPKPTLPGLDDLPDEPAEPETPLTPEQIAEQERREAEAKRRAKERRQKEEEERKLRLEKMGRLPLHPERPFLERGFIVTATMKIRDKGRSWWRTSRGGYVETSKVYRRGKPKVLELGAVIPEDAGFPFGFIGDDKEPVYGRQEDGKLRRVGSLEYRTFVQGAELVTERDRQYMRTAEDKFVRVSDLRLATAQARPEGVGEDERWIDVDLKQQLLVAYEGDRPVFTTLVSSGRKGTTEEPFDTPTGTFRVQTKHVSSSMDGNTASDGNYSIQDVPWAIFFDGNYALHGAFWHSGFGGRRSHGCINLAPGDARWLFWWVLPELPKGWHGAAAHEGASGTTVVVR